MLLAEVRRRLDDHSSLLCPFHEMLSYDVSKALHDYLRPFFDAVDELTVALALCQQVR